MVGFPSSNMAQVTGSPVLLLFLSLVPTSTYGFVIPKSSPHARLKLTSGTTSRHGRLQSSASTSVLFSSLLGAADDDATTITNNGGGGSYIRWKTRSSSATSSDVWELQTAVTTFQRTSNPSASATAERETTTSTTNSLAGATTEKIELHAQVHYGNFDYFNYYNSPDFIRQQDEVLYELLVDDELLGLSNDKKGRVLTQQLQASPNDESVANDYGWECQVNVMDYTQPNWKHADFTRQELQAASSLNKPAAGASEYRPLWQQVSTGGTAFWQPAVSALLVGPPSLFVATDATTSSDSRESSTKRKLFTNLFLPGNQLTGWLRAALWMTVPAPEISVLLLDWSSLFLSKNSPAKFSPVTLPILQAIMTLKITQLRQLVFGQVLVSGNSAATQQQQQNQDWNLLVTQRNDHALNVLKSALLDDTDSNSKRKKQMALLYGCSHCPDLHTKLVRDMGFSPMKTEWRTAWSLSVPKTFQEGGHIDMDMDKPPKTGGSSNGEASSVSLLNDLSSYLPPTAWAALAALFPLYLGVGAVDWIDTIHSSAVSLLDNQDPVAFGGDWSLYLVRHVLLYIGVSKFALEWQDPNLK